MKRFLIIVLCVMLASFALVAVLWAAGGAQLLRFGSWSPWNWNGVSHGIKGRYASEIDQRGECAAGGAVSVRIKTISSAIHIHPAKGDTLSAELKGTFYSSQEGLQPELVVERNGGNILVEVRYPNLGNVATRADMDLTVYLPDSFSGSLGLESVSADADVSMPLALEAFSFDSVSGSMHIADVTARRVSLATTSGSVDIEVTGCDTFSFTSVSGDLEAVTDAADVDANTTSGRVELHGLTGSLKATSISGGIAAEFEKLGDVNIDTTSGGVSLTVPSDSGFSVSFDTASGDFNCGFPITITESGKMRTRGTVGEGGSSIHVQTVSGNLRIQ